MSQASHDRECELADSVASRDCHCRCRVTFESERFLRRIHDACRESAEKEIELLNQAMTKLRALSQALARAMNAEDWPEPETSDALEFLALIDEAPHAP